MSVRILPVPEGLAGERVDSALARMLGLSRSKVGQLCGEGLVLLDGVAVSKSERLAPGATLEVDLPEPRGPEPVPTPVADLGLLYVDADIVVVDKPAGIAAHPSMGWEGPDVLGAL